MLTNEDTFTIFDLRERNNGLITVALKNDNSYTQKILDLIKNHVNQGRQLSSTTILHNYKRIEIEAYNDIHKRLHPDEIEEYKIYINEEPVGEWDRGRWDDFIQHWQISDNREECLSRYIVYCLYHRLEFPNDE